MTYLNLNVALSTCEPKIIISQVQGNLLHTVLILEVGPSEPSITFLNNSTPRVVQYTRKYTHPLSLFLWLPSIVSRPQHMVRALFPLSFFFQMPMHEFINKQWQPRELGYLTNPTKPTPSPPVITSHAQKFLLYKFTSILLYKNFFKSLQSPPLPFLG